MREMPVEKKGGRGRSRERVCRSDTCERRDRKEGAWIGRAPDCSDSPL